MVKLSPTSRSKPERLIKIAYEYFSKDKIVFFLLELKAKMLKFCPGAKKKRGNI